MEHDLRYLSSMCDQTLVKCRIYYSVDKNGSIFVDTVQRHIQRRQRQGENVTKGDQNHVSFVIQILNSYQLQFSM